MARFSVSLCHSLLQSWLVFLSPFPPPPPPPRPYPRCLSLYIPLPPAPPYPPAPTLAVFPCTVSIGPRSVDTHAHTLRHSAVHMRSWQIPVSQEELSTISSVNFPVRVSATNARCTFERAKMAPPQVNLNEKPLAQGSQVSLMSEFMKTVLNCFGRETRPCCYFFFRLFCWQARFKNSMQFAFLCWAVTLTMQPSRWPV